MIVMAIIVLQHCRLLKLSPIFFFEQQIPKYGFEHGHSVSQCVAVYFIQPCEVETAIKEYADHSNSTYFQILVKLLVVVTRFTYFLVLNYLFEVNELAILKITC